MNMTFWLGTPAIVSVFVCLMLAPLLGGLIAGVQRHFLEKSQGRTAPSVLKPLRDFFRQLFKEPLTGSTEQWVCVTLHLVFAVLSLAMLALQMNLLPILFVQAFSASALIILRMEQNLFFSEQGVKHALEKFLAGFSLLFIVAIGIFFLTGTFKIAGILAQPQGLWIELPLILAALLALVAGLDKQEETSAFSGPMLACVELARCYGKILLLLFAGLFFAHSLTGVGIAALLIQFVLMLGGHSRVGRAGQGRLDEIRGYVFFACGLNLTWIYLKYWM